ncbi:radical SAM protein [Chitinispirillales bacterium ANBcel5]|uniref:B12-binding domain-containing radical SAM protein n=1 Tax=Cellulosispirillum alkaliphilum TaxID=3039283 RepID=UPI002A583FD0|nr:radical SAM protein [Chitinispirillales bacterium ANBcel5]
MRLVLINPCNPLVSTVKTRENRWNKYVMWKPLGLLVLAGLTPDDWEITVIDENLVVPDYEKLPSPDLVGITAFTSQAPRAYEIAGGFRDRRIPVVMGGIHASMCTSEALERVDAVVKGEAESVWAEVLKDCRNGTLKRLYEGAKLDLAGVPAARHDLLSKGYRIGSIQTSRGCPLACSFCSVTTFNGGKFRRRPVENVIQEFRMIREKYVLIVDDNLIGTRKDHLEDTKNLLREMIAAKLRKKWIAQVTINMADDQELITLARKAGCIGVFIGFESVSAQGLSEISKKFNIRHNRVMRDSVRRIQNHGISVLGSFILGLDVDDKGSGKQIAQTARAYALDILNLMILTPLPGTQLWKTMEAEGRILTGNFPCDWKYFTLTLPVARYKKMSWKEIVAERESCYRDFYSYAGILRRVIRSFLHRGKASVVLISNLVLRTNSLRLDRVAYADLDLIRDRDLQ